jgi:hypothetical protein
VTLRRFLVASAAALALTAAVLVPAAAAEASTTSGVIKVQLTDPRGADWQRGGIIVAVSGVNRNVYREATTNGHGVATFSLPQGKYRFTAEPYRTPKYYQYAVSQTGVIGLSRGQTKTIGAHVALGAVVKGRVTTPTGAALRGAWVAVTKPDGVIYGFSKTDAHGRYVIRGLASGKYRVIFNWHHTNSAVERKYSWSFWRGPSFDTATRIQVFAANRFVGPTTTRNIDGRVGYGTLMTVALTLKDSSAELLLNRTLGKSRYSAAESVYSSLASGRVTVRLQPGLTYKLGVQYGEVQFWYQGEGKPLTRNNKKALLVSSGSLASVTLPAPQLN